MKNYLLSLLALFFLNLPNIYAQSVAESVGTSLELTTANGTLKGTLLLPASSKPVKVVLLISGSGPTDRDGNNPIMKNNSLKLVAEALYAQGVATLRYDKRGIAESKEAAIPEQDLRFDHYVKDATAWLQKLKTDKRFSKVIVLGHSEGSLIGMVAAREAMADGFISVAGPGQSADKVIRQQLQAQPKMVTDMALPILDQLVQGKPVAEVNPMLASLFRPSIQPYIISWFQYDPQVEIKKLSVPVLVVQGTQDLQVTEQEAQLLKAAQPKSKLAVIEGMNHVLKETTADKAANASTYNQPALALAPKLMPEIIGFIATVK
ncbi:alpha/beta hydrolase [Rufibacter sp. LB8]|uniref:alpha/beta hydrolase n=1 Tax=Rufibacter sp. LB8 TaxID=2777781 RepID=UPI00178C7A00|nr:alpha/beta fold hydrolase [Rufibacter sp. LB8]